MAPTVAAVEVSEPSVAYPRSAMLLVEDALAGREQIDQGGIGGEADRPVLVGHGPLGRRLAQASWRAAAGGYRPRPGHRPPRRHRSRCGPRPAPGRRSSGRGGACGPTPGPAGSRPAPRCRRLLGPAAAGQQRPGSRPSGPRSGPGPPGTCAPSLPYLPYCGLRTGSTAAGSWRRCFQAREPTPNTPGREQSVPSEPSSPPQERRQLPPASVERCHGEMRNGGVAAGWFSEIARECAPGPQGRPNRPSSTILLVVGRRRRPIDGCDGQTDSYT